MEDLTCMDYLLHCAGHSKHDHITQNLLLNASNEFRNIWNLVKKLQSVSRIDVNKITRFLDGVQDGLMSSESKKWETVSIQCVNAEHEYRQIKKYIRPSYLDDYMVVKFVNISRSKPKADVKSQRKVPAPSVHHRAKQSFRNNQIYRQHLLKVDKHVSVDRQTKKSSQNIGALSKTNAGERREIGDGQENANTDNKNDKAGQNHNAIKEINNSSEAFSKSNVTVANRLSESSITTVDEEDMEKEKRTDDQELNKANIKTVLKDKAENHQKVSDANPVENDEQSVQVENEEIIKAHQLLPDNIEVKKTNDDKLTIEPEEETENKEQSGFANGGSGNNQNDTVSTSKQMSANSVSHEIVKKHHGKHKFRNVKLDPLLETSEYIEIDHTNNNKHETDTMVNSEMSNDCQYNTNSSHKSDNETIQRQTSEETTLDRNIKSENQRFGKSSHDETNGTDGNGNRGTKISNKSSRIDVGTTPIISDRSTGISTECNYDEFVAKLSVIFEVDWEKAFKILTCCKPSNGLKNSISFLGEILKVSSQKVSNYVENMSEKGKGSADESSQTVRRQIEIFLKSQLPNLHDEFNIVYGNPEEVEIVQAYAAKCVEIAWFMSIQSPPLIFDYESRPMLLEDLFLLFKPYKNKGHLIQYVVWPVVRQCDTGEVIAKGIAEFR